jgi:formate hydrogenlyase subunit 3/multisubunit Na+/H+ antiporter MnhD subunit
VAFTLTAPVLPLLLVLFFLMAATSFVLRAWSRWVALAGAVIAALLGLGIWQVDFSRPLWVLPNGWGIDLAAGLTRFGYTFQLQQDNMPIVALSLLIAACALLLFAANGERYSMFPGLSWLLVGGYVFVASLTAGPKTPVIVVPLALAMLSAAGVFVVQNNRVADPSGPLRMLIPPLLAAPLFLLAAWYIDQIPLNPQDVGLTQTAGLLLGLGLLALMAPFPLHGALPSTAETAAAPALFLVSLLRQLAVLHLTARVLFAYPFVYQQTDWPIWLSWLGLLTTVWGGVAALGALNAGRLWGYAALSDWGLIIVVLAAPGLRSWTLVLFLFTLRVISMATSAVGFSAIQQTVGSLDLHRLRGIGSRMPWNSAAVLLGGLGLVGFPLSAGFAAHWAALLTLAELDWRPAAVVLVASVGAFIGYVRLARMMFGYLENRLIPREQTFSAVLALGALTVTIGVALAPQLLNDIISRALAAFG